MNSTEILDAVNARLLEKWPERTVYINVCPEDYERPSFWLEVTRDDRTPVTQRMTKRNVQIRLTLHDEADEHYDISWARLNNDVSACLKLMMQVLHVGARRLLPQLLQSMPRDVDRAAILVSTRISRGAVALILRDAKANGVHVVCQESDIPTTLGADNIAYIKRTLMGYINRPSAVYVSVVPAAGTIAAGFSALAAYTYDYIAGPSDISAEDATALAALVKERRKLRYIGKAVLPNTAADYEGVINFVSAGIAAGGKTAFSAAAYCSRIAGMLAGTPAQCSATYAQLSEVTGVTATENPDAAVDAGKLFIIDDGRVRKLSRAVTSKVTIGDTEPEALKKIKMTAAIDLIRYYAVSSVEDDYFGKCANTYDDKCVLLLALQDYLKSLEDSKVLESGSSGAVLDADATCKYLITAAGDDATEAERIKKLSDNEVIKENTGSKVFLKLYGNIMDAMEDFAIVFEVSPSVIAA